METVLDYDLFLGFEMTPAFHEALSRANPYAVTLLLDGDEATYLKRIERDGKEWIGKVVDSPFDIANAGLLEENIYSLAKRLSPSLTRDQAPLHLFAISRRRCVST